MQRGVSLIVVLVMLVVIGLTAGASMRGAISSEKVVNNLRLEALAQQYAEMALRYCEAQMGEDTLVRVPTLQDIVLPAAVPLNAARWNDPATWTATPGPVTTVPAALVASVADSSFAPARLPQCLVDRVALPTGLPAYVVTARGFSPGYQADPGTGATRAGTVVWLQSVIAMN